MGMPEPPSTIVSWADAQVHRLVQPPIPRAGKRNDQARVGLEREKSVTMGTRWGAFKRPSTHLPFPKELSFREHRE